MESTLAKIVEFIVSNGPGYILASIFIVLYLMERKRNEILANKLHELGMSSLKSTMEYQESYRLMEKAFNAILQSGKGHAKQ